MLWRTNIPDPHHAVALVPGVLIDEDFGASGLLDVLQIGATRPHEHPHKPLLNGERIVGVAREETPFASCRKLRRHALHWSTPVATFLETFACPWGSAAAAMCVPCKLNVTALATNPIALLPLMLKATTFAWRRSKPLHTRLPWGRHLRFVLIQPSQDGVVSSIRTIASDANGCHFLLAKALLDDNVDSELVCVEFDSLLPFAQDHTHESRFHNHFSYKLVTAGRHLWSECACERLVHALLDQLLGQLNCFWFANQAEQIYGIALFGNSFRTVAVERYVSTTLLL
mmetsp:Transcript_3747/g.9555  ORF Transcript_3747/g.9555 Transcript_3747/m.9555 type:complete len:285 (-) Transcript_3747:1271-2125(-)